MHRRSNLWSPVGQRCSWFVAFLFPCLGCGGNPGQKGPRAYPFPEASLEKVLSNKTFDLGVRDLQGLEGKGTEKGRFNPNFFIVLEKDDKTDGEDVDKGTKFFDGMTTREIKDAHTIAFVRCTEQQTHDVVKAKITEQRGEGYKEEHAGKYKGYSYVVTVCLIDHSNPSRRHVMQASYRPAGNGDLFIHTVDRNAQTGNFSGAVSKASLLKDILSKAASREPR